MTKVLQFIAVLLFVAGGIEFFIRVLSANKQSLFFPEPKEKRPYKIPKELTDRDRIQKVH